MLFVSLVLFASSRRKAEKSLREQGELLQVTLASIGDAVIATDVNGRVNFINPTAAAITGWDAGAASGKAFDEVFQIINEDTGEPIESPFAIVKREGKVLGLANHTVLITRDGRRLPIKIVALPSEIRTAI